MKKEAFILIFIIGFITSTYSQQLITDNQHIVNKFSLSPAYAGLNGNIETFFTHRQNWLGIPGAPRKEILNLNMPFKKNAGLGISIVNEETGNYEYFYTSLTYAYHVEIDRKQFISFGLSADVYRNQLDLSSVKGDTEDPLIIDQESLYGTTVDATAAVLYKYENLNIGIVGSRLIGMKVLYEKETGSQYTLSRHFSAFASYELEISKKMTVEPHAFIKTTQNSPLSYEVSGLLKYNKQIWTSLSYRSGNNITVGIGGALDYKIVLNYCYEFGFGGIQGQSSGSHEISVGYLIKFGKRREPQTAFRPEPPPPGVDDKELKKLETDFKKYKKNTDGEIKKLKDRLSKIEETTAENSLSKYKKPYVLKNIKFGNNSDKLFSSSFPSLDKLVKKLKENPSIEIMVTGHTDNVGSPRYNLRLSKKRAESVKQYLISKGVDDKRIVTDGKGSANPIASNSTREGKARNRRIEVAESR